MKCGLMRKIVTWEWIQVSALGSQTVSNERNVRISVYLKRHEDLVQFFKMERGLVACNDIDGLMQTLHINHNLLDWRLFTDSSKLSLKAVLLHNGNTLPSIPVGHSVHDKELYENVNILMDAINYDKSNGKSVVT